MKLLGDRPGDGHAGDKPGGDKPAAGRDATVAYRNRVQEVKVPPVDRLPAWGVADRYSGLEPEGRAR